MVSGKANSPPFLCNLCFLERTQRVGVKKYSTPDLRSQDRKGSNDVPDTAMAVLGFCPNPGQLFSAFIQRLELVQSDTNILLV